MDRAGSCDVVGGPAVRPGRAVAVELLLRAHGDGKSGKPGADAPDRPAVSETPVLRLAPDDRLAAGPGVGGGRESHCPPDEYHGAASGCARPTYVETGSGAQGVSVSPARARYRLGRPGLVCGHHLRPHAERVLVSGGGDGLVQPVCPGLGALQHVGVALLSGGVGAGLEGVLSRDLQHRPRLPVYRGGVYGTAQHPPMSSLLKEYQEWTRTRKLSRSPVFSL